MEEKLKEVQSSLVGEYGNIGILLSLYALQSIPMGMFHFVAFEVKGLFPGSFSEVGTFVLASWPFSLKLLWAPLVDSWYYPRFGRRKTWMVPAQIGIGVVLIFLSSHYEDILAAKDVSSLTLVFSVLYFMCATQDIAVDGWALTLLRPENCGYASTCNAIGQTLGHSMGLMIPMTRFVRFEDFAFIWGTAFIATTVAVAVCKREAPVAKSEKLEGLREAYTQMGQIMRRPPFMVFLFHLLTRSLPFVPVDSMAPGRLQDLGFHKEHIAFLKMVVVPVDIVMPWLVSKVTSGPRPLSLIMRWYLPRVSLTVFTGCFSYLLVSTVGYIPEPTPPVVFLAVFVLMVLQGAVSSTMFAAHMAFFARISDPSFGGTYMTFLNTTHNMGNILMSTVCLKSVDLISDVTGLDGFHTLCVICSLYGLLWFIVMKPVIERIGDTALSDWRMS